MIFFKILLPVHSAPPERFPNSTHISYSQHYVSMLYFNNFCYKKQTVRGARHRPRRPFSCFFSLTEVARGKWSRISAAAPRRDSEGNESSCELTGTTCERKYQSFSSKFPDRENTLTGNIGPDSPPPTLQTLLVRPPSAPSLLRYLNAPLKSDTFQGFVRFVSVQM